ncbi:MAG: tyrosine--tRNA ligase [Actinobacteria bacterium]|nr:tyrosine--tRNA ligase [Actinomycetota bacterium]
METGHALDVLAARGFIADLTDEAAIRDLLTAPTTFYVGFDPTAPSLHIGHLMGMMAMAWLQRSGHRALAVAGGGTGRIGDPSFRDDERELLDDDQIDRNLVSIRNQLSRFLDLDDPGRGILLDNYSWLGEFGYVEFLREVGKYFSVNQMIARESVKRRLSQREQGISYTEFSYALLQAYDFAHLHEAEGCMLQAGGSDQWGNIVAGIDLTRRMHGAQVHGLVWPLVERSDGRKFSKSTGSAVWLDAGLTSPYAFYQWFLNVPDDDAGRFLRWFTFLPLDRIADLEAESTEDPAGRAAQRALAEEITRTVHGDEGLEAALAATSVLFGSTRFRGLDDQTLADAFESAPSADLPRSDLEAGMGILSLMTAIGAAASNGEARRLVEQGGVSLNNERIDDPGYVAGVGDLAGATTLVVRVGKKRYYLARFA